MFKDRRQSPRHPTLLRTLVTYGAERVEVVCTDSSAMGAFFTARTPPPVGTEVTVELRAGGVDGPIVNLIALVSRTSLPGSVGSVGFAVVWRFASSESGPEPLYRVLRNILHVADLGDTDPTSGRAAEFAFPDLTEATALDPAVHKTTGSQRISRALGVWSPPLHRTTGGSTREAAVETGRHPAQHPVELEPQAPVVLRPTPQAAPIVAAAPTRALPVSAGFQERSAFFHGFSDEASIAIASGQNGGLASAEEVSQSWPVYSLAPGERREVSRPDWGSEPVRAPTAHKASPSVAREGAVPAVVPPHAPSQPQQLSAAQAFQGSSERTEASHEPPALRRKQDSGRLLAAADVPITYVRADQLYAGHLTGIAEQLACVVTLDEPPGLDEALVLHLPVRVDQIWRSVQVRGRLLQIATDTPAGKRFVMHIERVEEGRHTGAFAAFLNALNAP